MKSLFKTLVSFMIGLLILLGLSSLGVAYFVDPNQFKAPIQQAVLKQTGHQLQLKGPIHWKCYPTLSLELNEVALGVTPSESDSLFSAEKIKVDLSWRTLLKRRLTFNFVLTLPIGRVDGSLTPHFKNQSWQLAFIEADLSSPQLKLPNLKVDELQAHIHHQDDRLTIEPLHFKIADAKQMVALKITLGAKPQWFLKSKGEAFELSTLLATFEPPIVSAKTSVDLDLQGLGFSLDDVKKTLSGNAKIHLVKGQLEGIDLSALLKHALTNVHDLLNVLGGNLSSNAAQILKTEAKNWSLDVSNKNAQTPFDELRASIIFMKGIASNADLHISHSDYHIEGQGTFQLNDETLDYNVIASLNQSPYPATDALGTYLFKMRLPIHIQGTFKNPNIQPDLNTYFNNTLQYVQKNQAAELLKKTLSNTLNKFLKPNG